MFSSNHDGAFSCVYGLCEHGNGGCDITYGINFGPEPEWLKDHRKGLAGSRSKPATSLGKSDTPVATQSLTTSQPAEDVFSGIASTGNTVDEKCETSRTGVMFSVDKADVESQHSISSNATVTRATPRTVRQESDIDTETDSGSAGMNEGP